jgi:hypothetical protein
VERAREQVSPGEVFYYADEFNISWHPTIRALWSPRGQQVTIPDADAAGPPLRARRG